MASMTLLENGVAAFEQAAVLGRGWAAAMTTMAEAFRGSGATLPLTDADGVSLSVLSTEAIQNAVSDYIAGRAPPDSREGRVALAGSGGFCLDHDHYRDEELRRDPFYQEFLVPRGCGWHAAASLLADDGGELCLSLKRRHVDGPFDDEDRFLLNAVLPRLRQAAWIGRCVARAAAGTDADEITLRLHWSGRLVDEAPNSAALVRWGFARRGGRLHAPFAIDQERLEAAVHEATRRGGSASATILRTRSHGRVMLRISPLRDVARQVLGGAAAIAALREIRRRPEPDPALGPLLRAFGLTGAEARVALLLAAGWPVTMIAQRLGIATGTARNQVKAVLAKTGVARQPEFVALAAALLR